MAVNSFSKEIKELSDIHQVVKKLASKYIIPNASSMIIVDDDNILLNNCYVFMSLDLKLYNNLMSKLPQMDGCYIEIDSESLTSILKLKKSELKGFIVNGMYLGIEIENNDDKFINFGKYIPEYDVMSNNRYYFQVMNDHPSEYTQVDEMTVEAIKAKQLVPFSEGVFMAKVAKPMFPHLTNTDIYFSMERDEDDHENELFFMKIMCIRNGVKWVTKYKCFVPF